MYVNLNIILYGDYYKNQKGCSNQLQLVFELVYYFSWPTMLIYNNPQLIRPSCNQIFSIRCETKIFCSAKFCDFFLLFVIRATLKYKNVNLWKYK